MSNQTLNTESAKRAAILEAVTLASCNDNVVEQTSKINRLMSISDDETLDYVLKTYALPYRDYKEGRRVIDRDTLIDTNEFIRREGYYSPFTIFCTSAFYIPLEGEETN
jgi:hypothetical protein